MSNKEQESTVKMQKCTGECGEVKPHTEEFFRKVKKGLSIRCKKCIYAQNKRRLEKRVIDPKTIPRTRICTGECGLEKELTTENFAKSKDRS